MSFCIRYEENGSVREEKFGSYYLSVVRGNELRRQGVRYMRFENTSVVDRSDISDAKLGTKYSKAEQEMFEHLIPNIKYSRIKSKKKTKAK